MSNFLNQPQQSEANFNVFDTSNLGQGAYGRVIPSANTMVDIISLHLQETGTYNDMFQREYQALMPNDSVNTLVETVVRNNLNTRGQVFSGIASDLIDLNMQSANQAVIPNGWGQKRFRFLLQTRERMAKFPGIVFYSYLQGFTDIFDVSLQSQSINPDTVFFINSFVRISEQTVNSANGPQVIHRIESQGQLLNGILVSNQNPNGVTHFLRPMDIHGRVQILNDVEIASADILDLRGNTLAGSQTVMNNYMNNTPTHYLSRLMAPIADSIRQVNYQHGNGNIVDGAVGNAIAQEPSSNDNPVVNMLERQLGRVGAPSFSVKELEYIDPSVGGRTTFIPIDRNYATGLASRGVGNFWNDAQPETQLAIKLLNIIPGVMWSNYMGMASFSITNQFGNNTASVSLSFVRSLTIFTPPESVNQFLTELETVVARDISYNHRLLFNVDVNVSILGDIQLNVSVSGSQPRLYVAPAFSSGVLNPVYTHDHQNYENFAKKMHSVTATLESVVREDTSYISKGI